MNIFWFLIVESLIFLSFVAGEEKCLKHLPEVNPKKYFHLDGRSLDIVIEMSNERITHQLSTWIFYIFIKEVIGYSKVHISSRWDNFDIESVMERLMDQTNPVASTTINLEVWIPPDYDTYATEFVKECGSVSPPGRFGWFIPIEHTQPIKTYYNPTGEVDVKSVHWRYFRDKTFAQIFNIDQDILDNIDDHNLSKKDGQYVCSYNFCSRSMYTPSFCMKSKTRCAVLLTSYYNATSFVIKHIIEDKLYVKVLFLGENLNVVVRSVKQMIKNRRDKSLVVLGWTPSDVILHEKDYISVSFENCERMNFTHNESVGYRYEMHRLVKVAWSKVEQFAKPLYDALRSFKFQENDYDFLLDLYKKNQLAVENKTISLKDIACEWMDKRNGTWTKWKQSTESLIYIGGIFPLSSSSYTGTGIVKAALMAMNAINMNKTLLSDYKLTILVTDGMCRADNVMKNFIDFIVDQNYYNNLVGVLGPACSDTVEPLAGVSRHYHIMVISYSAEGSSFSDRGKYPYFFRTIGENQHYNHVYLALFKKWRWKRIAALTEDGQKYTEYISLLQDELEQDHIAFIANKKFPRERAESEPMTRYLEDLKNKRARIIIADVVDDDAREVMCEAYKLKMTASDGYVWFLPMWLNRTWYNTDYFNAVLNEGVKCTTEEMIKAINGYFSMTHAYYAPDNATMQEGKSVGEWKAEYQKYAQNQTSDYGGFAYDAVWVYALALDKLAKTDPEALSDMHSESTTDKLVKLVEGTDFYGVSGRIKFRGGPSRFSVINILEWYNNTINLIGEFYPNLTNDKSEISGGELILNNSAVKWFTENGQPPDDGTLPPPICAIESFAKAFNVECQTAVIILNVIVAAFLILVVCSVCVYLKLKYDQKVKKQKEYMESLGIYGKKVPANLDDFEVPREHVTINRKLGEGFFGKVYGGELRVGGGLVPVAVKTLKLSACTEDQIDFLSEADNMKRFEHPNIVRLLGVVTKERPIYTLMECMLYGDLKTFLLARRHLVSQSIADDEDVSPKRLTCMALDIARGLSFLADQKFVHRDIACRNCLINAQKVVKIGDFGMTRPINDYDCYGFKDNGRRRVLPVRWMPPESIVNGIYSPASDVWSYGVTLYEIVTFGCTPFYDKTNVEVIHFIKAGHILEIPKGVKPMLEALMKNCWKQDPKQRTTASQVVEFLANNPRLLSPCMDIPLMSLELEEMIHQENNIPMEIRQRSVSPNFNSPKAQITHSQNNIYNDKLPPICHEEDLSFWKIPNAKL
ncbi:receptor-type guanylate cyclase gcy-13-like isoform X2 [Cylas formicarius]|uniref:receptor-type guanylate cyclase gcy-13-like isoform X2 n=1 Tax=Cylas formicarius TaxID=197179 RepID=UPI0029588260|nr:receptor-type guanylate cyclase gcy-13-like isoform X2 [Cylas formicarius]